jgi:hypothetical protein
VLTLDLAGLLRDAGLDWTPRPGDRFVIPDRDMDDEIFVLSDMTIEVHRLPEGPVLGFNGTTEWALDDIEQDEAVWLPREDQLRAMLGDAFHRLERIGERWVVVTEVDDHPTVFGAASAEEAYAQALLHLLMKS